MDLVKDMPRHFFHGSSKIHENQARWIVLALQWGYKVLYELLKTVIRSVMMHGLETVALTKHQKIGVGGTEMKALHFSVGVRRL